MDRCVVVDVGSTTTKAVLLVRGEGGWTMTRRESPTTVEAPDLDVRVGLTAALGDLEAATGETLLDGERPTLPLFATSSAGGGLAMVVTGLVKAVTTRSAELAALGAGAILLDTIAMDDGRVPWRKVEALRRVRPDLLLFAGGFDGGAISGPVTLAELVHDAALTPKLDPGARLPVLYAGNADARGYVEEVLADRYRFEAIPNLRPESDRENLEPARKAILETFHEHVMSHAPGYAGLVEIAEKPVLPTPTAVSELLRLVSARVPGRILVVDVGGATTDVFTAEGGNVFRTVSANLGMSYSALHVLRTQDAFLRELLAGGEYGAFEDRVAEKHVHPTRLPATEEDVRAERAIAAAAVRGAVREHLAILGNTALSRGEDDLALRSIGRNRRGRAAPADDFALAGYDLIVGSGGALSHPPREATAALLVEALRPVGVVRLGVDRAFVFPHLGVLSRTGPELALALWEDVGFVPLGTLVAPAGRSRRASLAVRGRGPDGEEIRRELEGGAVATVPLPPGTEVEFAAKARGLKLGAKRFTAAGGEIGLLLDARGRPPEPARAAFFPERSAVPPGRAEAAREPTVEEGRILVRRELAVPGDVLVAVGDEVEPETPLCRSVRTFPRPFFVEVAGPLGVSAAEFAAHLTKREGEEVEAKETIAELRGKFGTHLRVGSPVRGRVERILPDGRVAIREKEEPAPDVSSVPAAEALGVRPRELPAYVVVEVGDEVDRGQALARKVDAAGFRAARSPIRGRVTHVDREFGVVLVAPLAERLEVCAGLPGEVVETSPRGAVVAGDGIRIRGLFGAGGEAGGPLAFAPAAGAILIAGAPPPDLGPLADAKVAGLLTGGLPWSALAAGAPPFPVVLLEGFGPRPLPARILDLLRPRAGRPALLDATTELRAGVRRPFLVVR